MSHQRGGENHFRRLFGPSKAQFRFMDHHLAHAISAFAYSGFDDAAILVLDGRGATEATSIWRGRNGRLEHLWTIPWPNSLGLFYAQFTYFLGFTPYSDEWKVMGLAPYGEPGINLREFIAPNDNPYRVATNLLIAPESDPFRGMEPRLGPPRLPESEIDARHKNLRFRGAGYVRTGNAHAGPRRRRKNRLRQSLPRRRRGAQFQSQRKNPFLRDR